MNNITKNILLGYVFIILLGVGCLGFAFVNFLNDINAVVMATCIITLLLLAVYIIIALINPKKKLPENAQGKKQLRTLLIILSLMTIILAILFFMFYNSIATFFIGNPVLLRSTVSILFVISMVIFVLLWFRNRKK